MYVIFRNLVLHSIVDDDQSNIVLSGVPENHFYFLNEGFIRSVKCIVFRSRLIYYYNVKSIQKGNIIHFICLGIILNGFNNSYLLCYTK